MIRNLAACLVGGLLATAGYAALSAQVSAPAQPASSAEWAIHSQNEYQVLPNLTYLSANGFDAKLDVYRRRDVQTPSRRWSSTTEADGSAARRKPPSCRWCPGSRWDGTS